MKLIRVLLEATQKPKAVIMAGGAGSGKTYLLNQLDLGSLEQFNPDKYIEDPDHPYYNNLGASTQQVNRDVAVAADSKSSFVWDTTASGVKFDENLDKLLKASYDVYMVMVYTHPMISYISNFARGRNIPGVSVFTTWRNAYAKIEEFNKKLKGNFSIFVNDRGNEFNKEIEGFNLAAKNGPKGIKDYLQNYNEKNNIGGSSFFKPVEWSEQEEQEFNKATSDLDWNKGNRSEDKAIKTAFLKAYQKIGVGPGADKLKDAVRKYRETKEKQDKTHEEVLQSIAEMLYSPVFQELLIHSTASEIDSAVQSFLS